MVNGLSPEAAKLVHDASQKKVAQPVEVAWPHVGHNRVDWITQKLANTRVYDRGKALLEPDPSKDDPGKPYDKLRMPTFYLNDEQVQSIVTFVISNRDRLITPSMTARATNDQAKLIARGRELVERYNCVSCHIVDHNAPQIQQYAKPEDITEKWPPSLRGQGNKVQHNWLFRFFKNVEPLRPLLVNGIRMPSFPATDDEWQAIIAYFNASSVHESKKIAEWLDPLAKSIEAELKASKSTTKPSEMWPAADWWSRPQFRGVADRLREWSLREGLLKPIEFDPKTADYNKAYAKALFYARFVCELYDAPFPFVDAGLPDKGAMTDAEAQQHFKLGEQLFYEMQCLKCHVLGDSSVPGAQQNPTAPNLSLAHERLQRRWTRDWVQEPYIIQLNTKMPPFLTGFDAKKLDGLPWPRSQGGAPEEVKRVEAKYGDTADKQAKLLLDFLYEAGARGYTGVQPAASAATAPTTGPATKPAQLMKHRPRRLCGRQA
jgi:cytochrome c2